MDGWAADDLLENWRDGRVKTFVTYRALRYRRDHPDLFMDGEYIPLEVAGTHSESVIAFGRRRGNDVCITVVPRFMTRIFGKERAPLGRRAWKDTAVRVPEGGWTNAITGEQGSSGMVGDILASFPVALLTRS